ncbi:5'/3'-nucleotidase SurE [Clostridium sp. LBM24168]
MKLLLTNDDGINAQGLYTLAKYLEVDNEVIIAAPSEQKSASSHSITVARGIGVKQKKIQGIKSAAYSISGTPADCVRVAVDKIAGDVDMVISGINEGYNVGIDVIYSGTVSAAVEAALCKIPSMAVSMGVNRPGYDYKIAAEYASRVLNIARQRYLKDDVVLSLNIPPLEREDIKGIKVCRTGFKMYDDFYVEKEDEDNKKGFYQEGKLTGYDVEGTDMYYIKRGYVTLTPLHYDLTNHEILKNVKNIFEQSENE